MTAALDEIATRYRAGERTITVEPDVYKAYEDGLVCTAHFGGHHDPSAGLERFLFYEEARVYRRGSAEPS